MKEARLYISLYTYFYLTHEDDQVRLASAESSRHAMREVKFEP